MDKLSFICGMVTAFSECVAAGAKPIALSPPMTRPDFLMAGDACARIIRAHGLRWYHEENIDLPPEARRDWMILYARDEALADYLSLRGAGENPMRSIAPFARVLGYGEERVETGTDTYRELFG
jgi:hypothetical protein